MNRIFPLRSHLILQRLASMSVKWFARLNENLLIPFHLSNALVDTEPESTAQRFDADPTKNEANWAVHPIDEVETHPFRGGRKPRSSLC